MEKKLKKLFDYQRFEKNERLEKIIRETESRYAKELSDDDLSLVNAAGETQVGGLSGENNRGSVSGYNTGGLTGSRSDEVGGLIGTKGGGGGGGVGGNGTAM